MTMVLFRWLKPHGWEEERHSRNQNFTNTLTSQVNWCYQDQYVLGIVGGSVSLIRGIFLISMVRRRKQKAALNLLLPVSLLNLILNVQTGTESVIRPCKPHYHPALLPYQWLWIILCLLLWQIFARIPMNIYHHNLFLLLSFTFGNDLWHNNNMLLTAPEHPCHPSTPPIPTSFSILPELISRAGPRLITGIHLGESQAALNDLSCLRGSDKSLCSIKQSAFSWTQSFLTGTRVLILIRNICRCLSQNLN